MKLKEYVPVIFDKIVIYYEKTDGEYNDIFIGNRSEIPNNILEMEVKSIGAKRKGVVDIRVKIS